MPPLRRSPSYSQSEDPTTSPKHWAGFPHLNLAIYPPTVLQPPIKHWTLPLELPLAEPHLATWRKMVRQWKREQLERAREKWEAQRRLSCHDRMEASPARLPTVLPVHFKPLNICAPLTASDVQGATNSSPTATATSSMFHPDQTPTSCKTWAGLCNFVKTK